MIKSTDRVGLVGAAPRSVFHRNQLTTISSLFLIDHYTETWTEFEVWKPNRAKMIVRFNQFLDRKWMRNYFENRLTVLIFHANTVSSNAKLDFFKGRYNIPCQYIWPFSGQEKCRNTKFFSQENNWQNEKLFNSFWTITWEKLWDTRRELTANIWIYDG